MTRLRLHRRPGTVGARAGQGEDAIVQQQLDAVTQHAQLNVAQQLAQGLRMGIALIMQAGTEALEVGQQGGRDGLAGVIPDDGAQLRWR